MRTRHHYDWDFYVEICCPCWFAAFQKDHSYMLSLKLQGPYMVPQPKGNWNRSRISTHKFTLHYFEIFKHQTHTTSLVCDVYSIKNDFRICIANHYIPTSVYHKEWYENEAGQMLTEFCPENALVIANTLFQYHKRRLYTWTSPDGQYRNQTDYILCSQRWRSSIQSAKIRLGVTVAQIINSLLPNSDLNWRK